MPRPFALSIAGFDPSGGAGVLADVKTFHATGSYGLAVATALTYQNEATMSGLRWSSREEIDAQLTALIPFYEIAVVKIGIVSDSAMLVDILNMLSDKGYQGPVLWDPVIRSTSKHQFFSDNAPAELLSKLDLITPNVGELQELMGVDSIEAACNLVASIVPAYVTSVASTDTQLENLFITQQGKKVVTTPLISACNKHGSGCVLSSAIASFLAQENSLETAIRKAQDYMSEFLLTGEALLGLHEEVSL